MPKRRLILQHRKALGDTVLLAGFIRDVHLAHPGYFEICVDANYTPVWVNNPYTQLVGSVPKPTVPTSFFEVTYKAGIKASTTGVKKHMLSWFHHDFATKSGMEVPVTVPKGDIHLTDVEKAIRPSNSPYWVIVAGYKADITTKHWPYAYWQQLIDQMTAAGIQCVQVGAAEKEHRQPQLKNVINLVGKQSVREYFATIYHAAGVVCPVTSAMHIAACFDKPTVVVAGGREEPWFEHYTDKYGGFGKSCAPVAVPHEFLHTLGKLDCCQTRGCWLHRVVALNDRHVFDIPARRCHRPETVGIDPVGACMKMVTPEMAFEAVLGYISKPAKALLPIVETTIMTPKTPKSLTDKFTVFVLTYGPHASLAKTCIDSILSTLPADRLDLRVGCNAVEPATLEYLKTVPVTKIYEEPSNPGKYVIMRKMFNDPDCPITTPYLVWFDDDTRVIRSSVWDELAAQIEKTHADGVRMHGTLYLHDLQKSVPAGDPLAWFRKEPWWRNRPLRVRGTLTEAPNGTIIRFAVGYFWAMATEMIKAADVPPAVLLHNGGDVTVGACIEQAGYKIASFNEQKSKVFCPTRENGGRRGKSDPLPWTVPAS